MRNLLNELKRIQLHFEKKYAKYFPKAIRKMYGKFNNTFFKREAREFIRRKFGKYNPNIVIQVFSKPISSGLLSDFNCALASIENAIQHGNKPFIDFQSSPTNFTEKNELFGTRNGWEYFWKQPTSLEIAEVYKSRHVIIDTNIHESYTRMIYECLKFDVERIVYWNSIMTRYSPLNDRFLEEVIAVAKNKLTGRNILGVSYRGTDFNPIQAKGHQKTPDFKNLLLDVEKKIKEWDIDQVYFTCDEQGLTDEFSEKFGDIVVTTNRLRYHKSEDLVIFQSFNRENDKYLRAKEYLIDMVLLSRCNYFIGSINNGTIYAIILNGAKYKDKLIYDLGVY